MEMFPNNFKIYIQLTLPLGSVMATSKWDHGAGAFEGPFASFGKHWRSIRWSVHSSVLSIIEWPCLA